MAPIRRYLRISKYSVLECRIYLDNPADTRWLLDSRDPVLPRIFAAIRPLVLPKLREENERIFAKKKSKPVKDVIAEDDFEVAIFLRESRTRHSLLTRHKTFDEPGDAPRATERQTGGLGTAGAGILVESDSDEDINLRDIPQDTPDEGDPESDDLDNQRPSKRRKGKEPSSRPADPDAEEDKKLRFRTNYESFNIHGWVLCLLVTRKGDRAGAQAAPSEPPRQALMEEWISTQAPGDVDEE
ncbi:hypothetical protein PHISP_03171 [Aspergillus sp. HF37]|nr:hypothetical protein PHISP_03171 [Aspergillus sp. HF37]